MEDIKENENASIQKIGINLIVYGCQAYNLGHNGKKKLLSIFYILEDDNKYLQWISESSKLYAESRINLSNIKYMLDKPIWLKDQQIENDQFYIYINIDSKNKDITIQFNDLQTKLQFKEGIMYFMQKTRQIQSQYNICSGQLATDILIEADKDGDRNLSFQEIQSLMAKLNINITTDQLQQLFDKYDANHNGQIDQLEFQSLIQDINYKVELKDIFLKYARNATSNTNNQEKVMTQQEFRLFLIEQQNQEQDFDQLLKLILDNDKDNNNNQSQEIQNNISFQQFSNFIFSSINSIFDIQKANVYQDMSLSLSNYYINSSHNTYLLENQLIGQSNTQAYVNALLQGCRCVELDCWNGQKEPIIYHGFTLTSKILFRDVIKVIKTYGFNNNKYPIILSIENHCDIKFQKIMSDIINEEIGDLIFQLPSNYQQFEYFPSPLQLCNKIIIKDKAQIQEDYAKGKIMKSYHTFGQFTLQDDNESQVQQQQLCQSELLNQNQPNNNEDEKEQINKLNQINNNNKKKNKQKNISFEYGKHITLFINDLDLKKQGYCWNINNINENKIKQLITKNEKQIIDLQKQFLTRIYPAGHRFDSSNFDPLPSFIAGSQIISQNYQKNDFSKLIYKGKFQENGGEKCGYLLKPIWMLSNSNNPLYPQDFNQPIKFLSLTIISCQMLTQVNDQKKFGINQIVDPYVKVTLKGLAIDEKNNKSMETDCVENNAFNPIFKKGKFQFFICCPDQAMLVFQVFGKNLGSDEIIGQYALSFTCMRQGYRVIPLWNENLNTKENSYIFVKTLISDIQR